MVKVRAKVSNTTRYVMARVEFTSLLAYWYMDQGNPTWYRPIPFDTRLVSPNMLGIGPVASDIGPITSGTAQHMPCTGFFFFSFLLKLGTNRCIDTQYTVVDQCGINLSSDQYGAGTYNSNHGCPI